MRCNLRACQSSWNDGMIVTLLFEMVGVSNGDDDDDGQVNTYLISVLTTVYQGPVPTGRYYTYLPHLQHVTSRVMERSSMLVASAPTSLSLGPSSFYHDGDAALPLHFNKHNSRSHHLTSRHVGFPPIQGLPTITTISVGREGNPD